MERLSCLVLSTSAMVDKLYLVWTMMEPCWSTFIYQEGIRIRPATEVQEFSNCKVSKCLKVEIAPALQRCSRASVVPG